MLHVKALGGLFAVVALVADTAYALAAAALLPLPGNGRRERLIARRLSGGVLVALGVLAACADADRVR